MNPLSEALRAIEPRQASAWMRARGWALSDTRPGHSAIYTKAAAPHQGEGTFEVVLPLNPAFADYVRRMAEVVEILSVEAGQPMEWVLAEVRASTFDIVRLRATGPGIGHGRVPLDIGARLFNQTRELLLAAACAAHEPRPVYRTRKPTAATEFLRQVKLAAPQAGSFIVTAYTPIPPSLRLGLTEDEDVPFERQATLMLARAAQTARQAAEAAVLQGSGDAFIEATSRGLSANFCEALAQFVDGSDTTALDIQMGWAASRAVPAGTPAAIQIGADLTPVLREGARMLRAREPVSDFELSGCVVRLDSEDADTGGDVVIAGEIDGQPRKVRVTMSADDYRSAIQAHQAGEFLRCEGELRRRGRRYVLEQVRHVSVLADDSEEGAEP
jgi:hypothetical protein